MKLIKTSSLTNHYRACVPCALSTLLNRPYEEVNNWLKVRKYRKHDNCGTFTQRMNMRELGLEKFQTPFIGKSVNQFIAANTQGEFFILVRGHALAVKNSIAFDTMDSQKKRIIEVWIKTKDILPDDWDWAQDVFKRKAQYEEEKKKKELQEKKRKEYYNKIKKTIKAKKNTAEYKLDQLLKRKKS